MKLQGIASIFVLYLHLTTLVIHQISYKGNVDAVITLRKNGYEGIVLAISEQVEEKSYSDLIDVLNTTLARASVYLFSATKQRAYFKGITILIPETWEDNSIYEPATSETYNTADIRVDYYPGARSATRARTVGLTQCGGFGQYILISPQRFYKFAWSPARMIVHEWGHLRYGLFDEYPYSVDEFSYLNDAGEVQVTRCNSQLPGAVFNRRTYAPCTYPYTADCVFLPQNPSVPSGSIMYDHNIPSVLHFCDSNSDDPATYHNTLPNNRHNRLCQMRSAWDIMRQGVDFRNNANPPANISDTRPLIRLVRAKKPRTVLVLDVSGSMRGKPMEQLQQAATNFLLNVAQNGSFVGIITFSSAASIRSSLVQINDDADRQRLILLLPSGASGSTSIGAGIQAGVKILKASVGNKSPSGGTLIVLSDGRENRSPTIADVKKQVLDNKITVQGISFGSLASVKLQSLCYETGGLSFFVPNDDTARLVNAFTTIAEKNNYGRTAPVSQIYLKKFTVETKSPFNDSISLDDGNSVGLEFTFLWISSNAIYTITAPDGTTYNATSAEYSTYSARKLSQFTFPASSVMVGEWKFSVKLLSSPSKQDIVATVTSKASLNADSDPLKQPVSVVVTVDKSAIVFPSPVLITVNVQKGYLAVLNAEVMLTISTPVSNKFVLLPANDKASGADLVKDDGIYSAFFTQFNANGRYSIQAQVKAAQNKSFINFNYVIGVGSLRNGGQFVVNGSESAENDNTNFANLGLNEFTRITSGSLIEVSDYVKGVDKIPPARVHGLEITHIDSKNMTITISFPAPGDDMDTGTASSYIIRYSANYSIFINDFQAGIELTKNDFLSESSNISSPMPAGTVEQFVVHLPDAAFNRPYTFALQAYDDAGLASPVSNYAQGRFQPQIPPGSGLTAGQTAVKIILNVNALLDYGQKPLRIM
ncbi:uncharacterized protein TRIADDRAFT_57367 [Trichoplax adhaerens]|uniref:VWFA domain-containing protein n=1 Tax=Trichoplax adhaerens TaxID=10228 RepID=B3RZ89_TRIAD|nr:hypothetical protein TRIADDRAFT_57367 [Trichoplax adhaerens]EDV23801.1 hypothetical protein TRIADDRAFT_57367 [Trichoplax adhaerens]|eukprot:XP_002113327.1 hypothetical protein TRIADDRAFT_57367 [Trichoplax adhaerens]